MESIIQNCKVVLIGDAGVGKTCISKRYAYEEDFSPNEESTNGGQYKAKLVSIPNINTKILMDIWDTAGQERFRSLTRIFYTDASIAILVFDVTRKKSFENLKKFWINELREFGPKDLIFGIAGNKSDKIDSEQVSREEAEEFAKEIKAIFKATSAKNNTGISELFEELGIKFFEKLGLKINKEPVVKDVIDLKNTKKFKENRKSGCC